MHLRNRYKLSDRCHKYKQDSDQYIQLSIKLSAAHKACKRQNDIGTHYIDYAENLCAKDCFPSSGAKRQCQRQICSHIGNRSDQRK